MNFRRTVGPAIVVGLFPLVVMLIMYCLLDCDGSLIKACLGVVAVVRSGSYAEFFAPFLPNFGSVVFILGFIFAEILFSLLIPAPKYTGPISPAGRRPTYTKNGVHALVATYLLGAFLIATGILPKSFLFLNLKPLLGTLNVAVFMFCVLLYIKGLFLPSDAGTVDSRPTGWRIFDFYFGVELYPRVGPFHIKHFIACRFGMMLWSVLNTAALLYQYDTLGYVTRGMLVSVLIEAAYTSKFFLYEPGYMKSCDMQSDKWGFYLCWGTCVWMPFVHNSQCVYLALHPHPDISLWAAVALGAVGLSMVVVNYLSDTQRLDFRESGGKCLIWGRPAQYITATYTTEDGKTHQSLLLCSGFWGLTRHFHYLPDLTVTTTASLPAGFGALLPYVHAIYLGILLFDRVFRQEKRCAAKYGKYWAQYKARQIQRCKTPPTKPLPERAWICRLEFPMQQRAHGIELGSRGGVRDTVGEEHALGDIRRLAEAGRGGGRT
ncbi:putative 7-dehydrocholesterol reductase [Paratrimastix pyriformis]|uniref:7-dehydrocholesterol reductase n=1 Tax=Paratrimastix pyriformis TaxID=342808 RepID=A0ABQ8UK92_9EUKA|nr:putative 7-dehydrocholesterol reductase [Paratrimastix pyriformis]